MYGSRVIILREIEHWIDDFTSPPIFWLNGAAGSGKTTIASSVSSLVSANPATLLCGSFFCSRSAGLLARRDVRCIVPTLSQLLARQSTDFSHALADELARDPDVLHKHVRFQVEKLLFTPLLALKDSVPPLVFVIDALDECAGLKTGNGASDDPDSHQIASDMLEALVSFSRSHVKLPVKFLCHVTTRNAHTGYTSIKRSL